MQFFGRPRDGSKVIYCPVEGVCLQQWACISNVNKGQGAVNSITDGQQKEQEPRGDDCTQTYKLIKPQRLS
ncbi:protein SEC13 homolog [Tachysurus ichikawai]